MHSWVGLDKPFAVNKKKEEKDKFIQCQKRFMILASFYDVTIYESKTSHGKCCKNIVNQPLILSAPVLLYSECL